MADSDRVRAGAPGRHLIGDCGGLPGKPPTPVHLRRAGWETITRRQVGLAEMAGIDLKRCHGKHWAPRWFVTLLKEAPHFAHQHQVTTARWIGALVREGVVNAVGLLLTKNEIEGDDVAFSIPRLLNKPVVFGDIRIHPDGRTEVRDFTTAPRNEWVWRPIDEEECRALDAEDRLTGETSRSHVAASILLDAYEKERERRNGKKRKAT